ncbi:MAG: nucleoside transporter C-terminal domain-containing protein [Bacteroidales bacterium]|jgi:CNT family concentrative nucleoside transporter|nr:nucleoside transporter C-terminal domain-containing protein [Bacteroidales bacterium]MDD2823684.1 nucleoside transporter C-terminal domain-containing protein [Bacteroidales bacterium]MDD3638741.1 nucleoside transporter C-terminal domain-containing protein [Bacteroidales bacterium]MDD4479972.1 nucleoside transporter C-terminal domain-containing protein [Bacteroidales bacterium]MDD5313612.1 nucleoside transporter C-terminal domain-containing protein [Bacteroidales bacterium]
MFCVLIAGSGLYAQNDSTVVFQAGTDILVIEDSVVEDVNPYQGILESRQFVFSFKSILRGIVGLFSILLIAWLFSTNKRKINWRTVGIALALQLLIALGILTIPAVQMVFEFFGKAFVKVLDWTRAGSEFLFGSLMDQGKFGYIFALQILPTIIFFSALTSLLFYWGVIQKVVWVMAWVFTKLMRISGAESLSTAGNIFLGQTEAPLLVKAYVPKMTRSEIMLIMTAGMSTMAGGVLAAYIGMLGGGDVHMSVAFAKHLLSASVMAAPGAIAMAKILVPQTEEIDNSVEVPKDKLGTSTLDSISNGSIDGLKLAANVAAMLLVFYALIAGANYMFGKIGQWTHLNNLIADWTNGMYDSLSLECILSYLFAPVIWLTGVSGQDLGLVGRLLGEKLIMTEFVGYSSLAQMIQAGAFASTKSLIIATYVLCGFANFASVGIQIGGIGGIAPNQRHVLAKFGFRALLGATLAALLSASMIGMFL